QNAGMSNVPWRDSRMARFMLLVMHPCPNGSARAEPGSLQRAAAREAIQPIEFSQFLMKGGARLSSNCSNGTWLRDVGTGTGGDPAGICTVKTGTQRFRRGDPRHDRHRLRPPSDSA